MQPVRLIIAALFALILASGSVIAQDKPKKEDGGAFDRFLGNEAQFFRLLPFNIPVIREGFVTHQVTLIISIETFGTKDKEKVIAARLKLQNAFLRDLYGVIGIELRSGQAFSAETVKIRLKRLAVSILGPDIVKDVLIDGSFNKRLR